MQMRRAVATCLIALLLNGCRTVIREPIPVERIMMMNSTGKIVDPQGNVGCVDGKPCTTHTKLRGYRELREEAVLHVDDVIAGLRVHPARGGKKRMLIYIHGGLNTGVGAIQRAAGFSKSIEDGGYYPLFINWNSALLHSYREHVFYIRQGEHWGWNPLSLILISPFYLAADVARAIVKAPIAWFQMIRSDRESRPSSFKNRLVLDRVVELRESGNAGVEIQPGEDRRSTKERNRAAVAYFSTLPTKLIAVPIIDGLGASAWETLIRRARVLFNTDEGQSLRVDLAAAREARGGLALFFDEVARFMNEEGEKGEWEITIVGHSMGTIVANEIIRTYVNRGGSETLPVRNVVYFAAATSLRDYEDTIFPFLAGDAKRQMYHLTLHRFSEVRDTVSFKIAGADVAPRGSLLVWIDNYLSRPNIPLDRTAGRFLNLMTEVHETPPHVASQIHIREFDAGEAVRDHQPLHHGDFGSIFFWKDVCWQPRTSYADRRCYCK